MAKMHSLAMRNLNALNPGQVPEIRMVRLADINDELAQEGARRWGWSSHCTDWKEITRAEDIDAVVIITPNDSHADIAIDALKHQKHVFCEKPLASTIEAAEAMAVTALSAQRVAMVNFAYRTWPAVELARQLIAEGEIGEILHFDGHYFQDYAADPELPFTWRFDKEVAGSGAFGDIGSHISDIACSLVGPVARVTATTRRIHPTRRAADGSQKQVTVDDLTSALVEFESGAIGAVHASWAATGRKCDLGFFVTGTKGAIEFNWERSNELHFHSSSDPQRTGGFRRIMIGGMHPGADPFWYAQGQGLGYAEAFSITSKRFIQAIMENNTSAGPNFAEALHVARLVDGVFRSVETASWQNIRH